VIGKIWQRLIREAMITIYRNPRTEFAKPLPVYYFAFDGDVERVGLGVQSLQAIDQIPWPDDACVILAEDVAASLICKDSTVVRGLVWMIFSKNLKVMLSRPESSELVYVGTVMLINDRLVHTQPTLHWLEHLGPEHFEDVDPDASKNKTIEALVEICASFGAETTPERYADYLDRVLVLDHNQPAWVAYDQESKQPKPGLAADFLAYLANLAIPCHYMLRSKPKKGFGPTGELKRLTKEKAIFSVIPHERLYHVFNNKHEAQREIAPHFRRGHIRHMWRQGIPPLNRFALPDDPKERVKLVHSHKVPRIYVHPTWVGDPNFEQEGFQFEVMAGEMPLRTL
jgi:hypothetical protein